MRLLAFLAAVLPLPVFAETIMLESRPTAAVVYPEGATVTHVAILNAEQGAHDLVLADLPPGVPLDVLRVSAPGVRMGALRYRTDLVPSRDVQDTEEIGAARARIAALEAQIVAERDTLQRRELEEDALDATVRFLDSLSQAEALPRDADSLRSIAQMIGDETRAAHLAALDIRTAARENKDRISALREDLKRAKQDLAALVPEPDDRPLLVVSVDLSQAAENLPLKISYLTDEATWSPVYDIRLLEIDTAGTGQIIIERGAEVTQASGENWRDIQLTLSTQSPSAQTEPSTLFPDLRRLMPPVLYDVPVQRSMAEPAMQSVDIIISEVADHSVATEGLAVTYLFKRPINIANGVDQVRVRFDTLNFPAEIFARAVPYFDDTAFLMARFTNSGLEPLLPSGSALRFFDSSLVGAQALEAIPAGASATLSFGPVDGLQLNRQISERSEGDRGIIVSSNERMETAQITVENIGGRSWPVELVDRVPFSEQEDLEITYRTSRAPDLQNVDGQRGILQWDLTLDPGQKQMITTVFTMTWPEGQVVR